MIDLQFYPRINHFSLSGLLPEQRNPLPPAVVPLTYSFPDQSGLTAVVEDKPNVINFDLK